MGGEGGGRGRPYKTFCFLQTISLKQSSRKEKSRFLTKEKMRELVFLVNVVVFFAVFVHSQAEENQVLHFSF